MLIIVSQSNRPRGSAHRQNKMASYVRFGVSLLCLIVAVGAVDHSNFKTCEQSSFCRRCRKMESGKSAYDLMPETVTVTGSTMNADLLNKNTGVSYRMQLTAIKGNTFRLHVNEKHPIHARYEVQDALKGPPQTVELNLIEKTGTHVKVANGKGSATVVYNPFRIDFYSDNQLVISTNARGLMRFEHLRLKNESKPEIQAEKTEPAAPVYPGDGADDDPGAWEETFKSHHDSKPRGPEAVAMDFSFPGALYAYGVPEHADSHALKSTKGKDPYRLYNLDVFEYEINSGMAIYGAIPVLYAHGKDRTAGVFWHNAAETWIDILSSTDNNVVEKIVNLVSGSAQSPQVDAHFMSESGVIDVFFLLGPKPLDTFKQYTDLTGTGNLPQMFALGYHQSRWNYNDQKDVATVADNFDTYDIPMDVMWLDIEYTNEKKYFTWDPKKFSEPLEMIQNLTSKGRKLVVIIDPHIKRDPEYFLHKDATDNRYYVKNKDGTDYEGWCWPGSSSYLDFFDPKVRDYYMNLYDLEKFKGTTNDVHIWNDMNEPSVFNGPEVTMPKDLIHHGDWEHRDVHNINGFYQTMSTYGALEKRSNGTLRPFILTRSFFAGSQRYAAMWTGDNSAEWEHLRISYPMCLTVAVAGLSFCGADVGGFFKNPDSELFIRWNQAGAWLPFFRQHSHIDTKRREPWTFNNETTGIVRDAIRMRYSYLPLWYTLFREHEFNGNPVIRPLWAHYPEETATFAIDDQLLVGDAILVRPVLAPSVSQVNVYFPGEGRVAWYDVDTKEPHRKPGLVAVSVTLHKIPVYQRGGSIVARKMRIRRSTVSMKDDPYTLDVIADDNGRANGTLYIDDEVSFDYRRGKYLYIQLEFDGVKLTSTFNKSPGYKTKSAIERIDIANPPQNVTSATLVSPSLGKVVLEAKYHNNGVLTLRKPVVNMGEKWAIELVR